VSNRGVTCIKTVIQASQPYRVASEQGNETFTLLKVMNVGAVVSSVFKNKMIEFDLGLNQEAYQNLIAGQWVEPKSSRYMVTKYPSREGLPEGLLPRSGPADVELAISAGQEAAAAWSRLLPVARCTYIREVAKKLLQESNQLAEVESLYSEHCVKKINLGLGSLLQFYSVQRVITPTLFDTSGGQQRLLKAGEVVKQVNAAQISSSQYLERVFTVLAGGHCVVNCILLRPNELMPSALLRIIEVASQLLPKGVLNVVFGLALEAGTALVNSNQGVNAFNLKNKPPAHTLKGVSQKIH
jgi:aldehyde dehydrogenase